MVLLELTVLLVTTLCVRNQVIGNGYTEEEALSLLRGEQGQYFCPGTNFCQTNQTETGRSANNCCKDCSCSEDCEVNNNCCFRKWKGAEDETCVDSAIVETQSYTPAYYMVTTCKPVTSNISMDGERRDCAEFNESSPWGPVNPVYSAKTDTIYLNYLCAECNGVKPLEQLHQFTLQIYYVLRTDVDLDRLVDDTLSFIKMNNVPDRYDTSITVNAPAQVQDRVSKKLCLEGRHISEQCSSPSSSALIRSSTMTLDQSEQLCQSNLFLPYIDDKSVVHKNIFCFICTYPYLDRYSCESLYTKKFHPQSFSIFISKERVAQLRTNELIRETSWKACAGYDHAKNGSDCKAVLCPLGRLFTTNSTCVFISNYFYVQWLTIFLKIELKTPILMPLNMSTNKYLFKTPKLFAKPYNAWRVKSAFHSVLKISNSVIEIRYLALYMEFKTKESIHDELLDEIEYFMTGDVHIVIENIRSMCSVEIFPSTIQQFSLEEKYNTNIDHWLKVTDSTLYFIGRYALAEYHFCNLIEVCEQEVSFPESLIRKTKVVIKQSLKVLYDNQFQLITKPIGNPCMKVCTKHTHYQIQANGSPNQNLMVSKLISLRHVLFLSTVLVSFSMRSFVI